MRDILRFAGLTCVLTAAAAGARAEVVGCTEITAVPFDVTAPGIYCLRTSLSASLPLGGVVISVDADDVVLDLNGHTLEAAGPTTAVGVWTDRHKNITVRNGTIRGFGEAVDLGSFPIMTSQQGYIVEDMRTEAISAIAIKVTGAGSIVRHNQVVRTGGSSGGSAGIVANGSGVHVVDNEVVETVEAVGAQALAINVSLAPGAVIERNLVGNEAFGPTDSVGIFVSPSCPNATVAANHVAGMRKGLYLLSKALYRDNTVGGATTAFTGGVAGGNTNFAF